MLIKLNHISVESCRHQMLRDVTCSFEEKKLHMLVGPNGSGKTTLLKTIAGLRESTSGACTWQDRDIKSYSHEERAARLSWVPTQIQMAFGYSVESVVLWGRFPSHFGQPSALDLKAAHERLDQLGMLSFSKKSLRDLSTGEQKKVHLARSLASNCSVLVWDEPFSSLDVHASQRILEILKSELEARTIICSVHDLNIAWRHADSVCLLSKGELIANGDSQTVLTLSNIQNIFSAKPHIVENENDSYLVFS
jgi:iron complex transport system ATP-binding protein